MIHTDGGFPASSSAHDTVTILSPGTHADVPQHTQ